jgi:diadenosine tetraphosphatase ApaH/serine/threonine PP2A family protein phosphatase
VRYAIISDIHANYDALEVVLDHIEQSEIDHILCLGDVVGYGAEPVTCMNRIRELGCDCIAGNHDWAAIERISIDFFNAYAKAAALWTREQLSQDHKDWLANLPLTIDYEHFSISHGTFHQPEAFNYIQTVFDAQLSFEELRTRNSRLGFLGHSHVPVGFFDTDPITYTLDSEVPTDDDNCVIVNVGSVGQPRDENPRCSYCQYDDEEHVARIVRLDYDIDRAATKIKEAGLDPILAQRLYLGK